MSPGTIDLLVLLASFTAAAAGVRAFARWAAGRRLLDIPNDRSSHDVPTPRGAGVVIVAVVSLAVAATSSIAPFGGATTAVAALTVAAVSAWDDVRSLPTWVRLVVHVGCAVVALGGIGLSAGPLATPYATVLGVLWIVGLTNAYNFMDGVDGIAGAQAVITGAASAMAAGSIGLLQESAAGTALAGAAAGFLVYNWPPARVFMGDVGSAFLGFVFAGLALQMGKTSVPHAVVVMASLWPFMFDTSLTLVRRAARGENIMASHRSHLYQRLVISGWSHQRVSVLYATLAAAGAAVGGAWAILGAPWFVLLAVPAMAVALWTIVRRAEDQWRRSPAGARASAAAGPRA